MAPTAPPVLLLAPGAAAGFTGLDGWTTHAGFDLADFPWDLSDRRIVCTGVVDDATTVDALELVARGAGLAIELAARGSARHRFLEDLDKLGVAVDHRAPPVPEPARTLLPLQRQLLDDLAAGATVTAAAEAAHVSRRTANRALADARLRLGASSNASAVRRWLDLRSGSPEPGS